MGSEMCIRDSKRRPTGAANAEAAAEWTEHNNQLFSILFFMTSESTNVTVKTYMSKDVGGMGDGAAASSASIENEILHLQRHRSRSTSSRINIVIIN